MVDVSTLPKPVDLEFAVFEPSGGADASKTPILIGHGLFSTKDHWMVVNVPQQLADRTKRKVWIFDVRDHGSSPHTNEFCFKAMISDTHSFIQKHLNGQKVCLVGHSLSGMQFVRFATLFPDLVDRVCLIDIHPQKKLAKPNSVSVITEQFKAIADMIKNEKITSLEEAQKRAEELIGDQIKDERIRKGLLAGLVVRTNGEINWRFNLDQIISFFLTRNESDEIKVDYKGPVLELYGSESQFINDGDIDSILALVPNCKFKKIEGADHVLPITHPTEFIEALAEFLEN